MKKIFDLLQQMSSKKAHQITLEAHKEVFERTHCLECAQCCKSYNPIVTEQDVYRIAAHLDLKPAQFATKYLFLDEDDEWAIEGSPCPFLEADNSCRIYDVRPSSCAEYPLTARPDFRYLYELTVVNATICPAVPDILEHINIKLTRS